MADMPMVKVMLVDDHEIVRDGLREVLERTGEFQVVGEAGDGAAAVEVALSQRPDVIIMDLILPPTSGVEVCREIMDLLPDTRVLMLTMSNEQDVVAQAIAAGATGFLQKTHGRETFINTVRDVAAGEYRFPSDALKRVLAGVRVAPQSAPGAMIEAITDRERAMLTMFVQGRSYAEIAEARGLRPLTVRNAVYGVQRKLGFANKQELVVWAVQSGLLDVAANPP